MESKEYMEIRNALIVLTKISNIFPVIRKSGINLEKRVSTNSSYYHLCSARLLLTSTSFQVAKLKGDDREDLKVLATGVAAALAARKVNAVLHLCNSYFLLPTRRHLIS